MHFLPVHELLEENEAFASNPLCKETLPMCIEFYKKVGFNPPWICYYVEENGELIGNGAFKGKPVNNSVEIAYGTMELHRKKGVGSRICRKLVEMGLAVDPLLRITARTLPEENFSTRILGKNNFVFIGTVNDPEDGEVWEWEYKGQVFQSSSTEMDVPARTLLLREGEVSRQAYQILRGCMRLWFNDDGRDITFQFFFEGQGVSSMESFRTGRPSLFNMETVEPCTLRVITKSEFDKMLAETPGFKELIESNIYQRLEHYIGLFLSRIRDTPQQRYLDLIRDHPEIIRRVPQHYIASYLGITPVSLSRIRNKAGKAGR